VGPARTTLPQEPGAVHPAYPPPRPALTGLGTGVVTTLVTVAGGTVDAMLTGEPGTLFGVTFVAVCLGAGLWVRPYDLAAAPISAPIAFTVALALTGSGGNGGVAGHVMGTVTGLAVQTGWLYGGTLCAAVVVAVRKLAGRRRAADRAG
jgi:hypothetical protein